MVSLVVIPQDIIDSIIEVVDHYDTLRTCALVSSSFLFPCRKRLFSKIAIYLRRDTACRSLHRVLIENPVIQSFVRTICIQFVEWECHESELNSTMVAMNILRLPFCRLEYFSVCGWTPSNWNDSKELNDVFSTIVHSPTLRTLDLDNSNLPITVFQGIHLAKLELTSSNFDREQSWLLTLAASQMMIDECVWRMYGKMDGLNTKSMFLPFMSHLRVLEISVDPSSARMRNFRILFFLIHSLRLSLMTPATLEHLKLALTFDDLGARNYSNGFLLDAIGRADIWSDLDSIITRPAGSRLTRVDIDIKYCFCDAIQPAEDEVMKPILDTLPLLGKKGILFVTAKRIE